MIYNFLFTFVLETLIGVCEGVGDIILILVPTKQVEPKQIASKLKENPYFHDPNIVLGIVKCYNEFRRSYAINFHSAIEILTQNKLTTKYMNV